MGEITIEIVKEYIGRIKDTVQVSEIKKGYSRDKKYRVTMKDGQNLLLRTGAIHTYDRKKTEFEYLRQVKEKRVLAQVPIEVGKIKELDLCYQLFTFLEGEDGQDVISAYTDEEQYNIGFTAGKDLAKIHKISAPFEVASWYERAIKKHERYVEKYNALGTKIKNDEKILQYIENHKHFLMDRPNQLQHDDFGLSNILVNERKYSGVIDFNNYDWGDPYHDFVKVALFTTEVSIPFAIGQLHGYFDNEIPEQFWKLYNLYVAMVLFSSIVWAESFGELEEMKRRINRILEEHHYFDRVIPSWYTENEISRGQ